MLKIIDDKLISESPLLFNSIHDTIEVLAQYPRSSVVRCTINGCDTVLNFYLVYSYTLPEGNVFKGRFVINKKLLNYINNHPEKDYTLSFKFGNISIEGEQIFVINYPALIRQIDAIPDPYQNLLEELSRLKAEIHNGINSANLETPAACNIAAGMVPISTDSCGNYKWDFAFIKEKEDIRKIATALHNISNQLDLMNNRLNSLEEKVLKHIYEEYEL